MSINHGSMSNVVYKHKALTKIAVLFTGLSSDINIFPFVLRYAQKANIELSILLSNDIANYPTHISNSLSMLKSCLANRPNCSFIPLDSNIYDSINELTNEVIENVDRFHLFLFSFISPLFSNSLTVDLITNIPFNRARTSSIAVIIQSLLPAPELDVINLRKSIGVPESFQESSLHHVELGIIGDKLKAMESTSIPNLLIFHESIHTYNKRRNSAEVGASQDVSNESSSKTVNMETFSSL